MKIEKWDIIPYTKVDTLTFGISQDGAKNMLGKESLKDFDKDENEAISRNGSKFVQILSAGLNDFSCVGYVSKVRSIGKNYMFAAIMGALTNPRKGNAFL